MLKGANITIRVVRERDLDTLLDLINTASYQGEFLPSAMTSETTLRANFAKDGFVSDTSQRYLIVDSVDRLVGSIWAFRSVPYFDALEVGYQIFAPADRGKGYATEALTLFHQHLFESKPVNRLELRIATENTPSNKLANKLGFTLEGVSRSAAFSHGRHHDMNVYSMLRSEWLANN